MDYNDKKIEDWTVDDVCSFVREAAIDIPPQVPPEIAHEINRNIDEMNIDGNMFIMSVNDATTFRNLIPAEFVQANAIVSNLIAQHAYNSYVARKNEDEDDSDDESNDDAEFRLNVFIENVNTYVQVTRDMTVEQAFNRIEVANRRAITQYIISYVREITDTTIQLQDIGITGENNATINFALRAVSGVLLYVHLTLNFVDDKIRKKGALPIPQAFECTDLVSYVKLKVLEYIHTNITSSDLRLSTNEGVYLKNSMTLNDYNLNGSTTLTATYRSAFDKLVSNMSNQESKQLELKAKDISKKVAKNGKNNKNGKNGSGRTKFKNFDKEQLKEFISDLSRTQTEKVVRKTKANGSLMSKIKSLNELKSKFMLNHEQATNLWRKIKNHKEIDCRRGKISSEQLKKLQKDKYEQEFKYKDINRYSTTDLAYFVTNIFSYVNKDDKEDKKDDKKDDKDEKNKEKDEKVNEKDKEKEEKKCDINIKSFIESFKSESDCVKFLIDKVHKLRLNGSHIIGHCHSGKLTCLFGLQTIFESIINEQQKSKLEQKLCKDWTEIDVCHLIDNCIIECKCECEISNKVKQQIYKNVSKLKLNGKQFSTSILVPNDLMTLIPDDYSNSNQLKCKTLCAFIYKKYLKCTIQSKFGSTIQQQHYRKNSITSESKSKSKSNDNSKNNSKDKVMKEGEDVKQIEGKLETINNTPGEDDDDDDDNDNDNDNNDVKKDEIEKDEIEKVNKIIDSFKKLLKKLFMEIKSKENQDEMEADKDISYINVPQKYLAKNRLLKLSKLVKKSKKPDCVDPCDEKDMKKADKNPSLMRAKLSCGCAVTATTAYAHLRNFFSSRPEDYELCCPIRCKHNKTLKTLDFNHFLMVADCDNVERKFWTDERNRRMRRWNHQCTKCHKNYLRPVGAKLKIPCNCGRVWCWWCLADWTGDKFCGNKHCFKLLDVKNTIINCGTTILTNPYNNFNNFNVPKVRFCPFCFHLNAYIAGCHQMTCTNCKKGFCYVCLETLNSHTHVNPSGKCSYVVKSQIDDLK